MKALHDRHRQDHKAVLMRLERSAQHIGHVPDHGSLFRDIRSDNTESVIRHFRISP